MFESELFDMFVKCLTTFGLILAFYLILVSTFKLNNVIINVNLV